MPQVYYPWAVFYRKSMFEAGGYEVPKTFDALRALCQQMQTDGLTPFAFGDKEGWPAMGTFDMLNMRINGYDYHVSLMAGTESWDSPQVKTVFDTWRGLLPFHQPDGLGRTWQEAAQGMLQKKSGLFILGTFINEQFPDDEDDLDFFTFPEVDSRIGATAIDAPIDGFCMSANPDNEEGSIAFLKYLASPPAAAAAATTGFPLIAVNSEADTKPYSAAAAEVGRAGRSRPGDRAVPRPRHPSRLRLHRGHPRVPAVHRQPGRRRRPREEHRGPEEVDLHELTGRSR